VICVPATPIHALDDALACDAKARRAAQTAIRSRLDLPSPALVA
jgi:hypothetical protein